MRHCPSASSRYEVVMEWEATASSATVAAPTRKGAHVTYNMANFRGLTIKTGVNMSPIQVANMAAAASSRPPKTSSRSHRLTADVC
jgi:hypothetical protein